MRCSLSPKRGIASSPPFVRWAESGWHSPTPSIGCSIAIWLRGTTNRPPRSRRWTGLRCAQLTPIPRGCGLRSLEKRGRAALPAGAAAWHGGTHLYRCSFARGRRCRRHSGKCRDPGRARALFTSEPTPGVRPPARPRFRERSAFAARRHGDGSAARGTRSRTRPRLDPGSTPTSGGDRCNRRRTSVAGRSGGSRTRGELQYCGSCCARAPPGRRGARSRDRSRQRRGLTAALDRLDAIDLLVTSGGASVGAYDLVRSALAPVGLELDFWTVAMRPGKPLIFGRFRDVPLLGVPGNPVSALVCGVIFARGHPRHARLAYRTPS